MPYIILQFLGGHNSFEDASVALELALQYSLDHNFNLDINHDSFTHQLAPQDLWGNAHALDEPESTIFSLAEEERATTESVELRARVYCSTPYSNRPYWERYAIGYWYLLHMYQSNLFTVPIYNIRPLADATMAVLDHNHVSSDSNKVL